MPDEIGNCACMKMYHKHLILDILNREISREKSEIKRVDTSRELLTEKGFTPDAMIRISQRFINTLEYTRDALKDVKECESIREI